jgi:ATP-dependent Clp protease ATP-binding subunit ClpC
MQTYQLKLTACLWRLENGAIRAECPSFPELSCMADSVRHVLMRLERGLHKLSRKLPRLDLVRRQSAGPVVSKQMALTFEPNIRSPAWQTPVQTQFSTVQWQQGPDSWVLWVPILGIHVLGRTEREVEELGEGHVRAAVARESTAWADGQSGLSLPRLAELQRASRVRLVAMTIRVPMPTPKLATQIAEQERGPAKSVLKEATDSLLADPIEPLLGNETAVEHLASFLTGRRPRSVLLVGPSGVGKTATLMELIRRRGEFRLDQADFRATSGARLVAGMSSFGMWQERCQELCREAEKEGVILHLGSLIELMEVGRSEQNSTGIASFLRPYLVRGAVLAVAECTPEQLSTIERQNPQLVQAFDIVRVTEPDAATSRRILAEFASRYPQPMIRDANGAEVPVVLIGESGLGAVERLHRRYATYSAFPGRPLRFLKNLLRDKFDSVQLRASLPASSTESGSVPLNLSVGLLTEADVVAAFARETGLPPFLLDDRIRFDVTHARQRLSRRVVGQETAVDSVIHLISTIKAGLARPGRPLASLMFIGPTGVGKTELGRALAEYLFGDEGRLTRFDMSEYGDPISAQRLIGGAFGDEGVLTAKIREQPFSLVLLDEFEKADPMVFDLMLQVFGEGRLTDGSGRLADFSNSVIVMTSNLGAESYQQGAAGFVQTRDDRGAHFTEAVRKFFRPEFYNRFDAIIPFQPLEPDVLRLIAELQVSALRSRDGLIFREQSWEMEPLAIDELVKRGFDPRYGARPLKRSIERELLAPLAEQINAVPPERTVAVTVSPDHGRLSVQVGIGALSLSRMTEASTSPAARNPAIADLTLLRRRTHRLIEGPVVQALRNEMFRLKSEHDREHRRMLSRTAVGKPWSRDPNSKSRQSRLSVLRTLADELTELGTNIDLLENEAFLGVLIRNQLPTIDATQLARLRDEWWRLAVEVYLQQFPASDRMTLAVFSEYPATLRDLVEAYGEAATALGREQLELWEYATSQQGADSRRVESSNPQAEPIWTRPIVRPSVYLNQIPEAVIGLAWNIAGRGLYPRFRGEAGLHLVKDQQDMPCLVIVEAVSTHHFQLPAGIGRRGTIERRGKKDLRREYSIASGQVIDPLLNQRGPWTRETHGTRLTQLIQARFEMEVLQAVIGSDKDLR